LCPLKTIRVDVRGLLLYNRNMTFQGPDVTIYYIISVNREYKTIFHFFIITQICLKFNTPDHIHVLVKTGKVLRIGINFSIKHKNTWLKQMIKKEEIAMKKTYRVTVDYELDFNKQVKLPEEPAKISREMVEKTQHIIDAVLSQPQVMLELVKHRLYWGFLESSPNYEKMEEAIELKEEAEVMSLLIPEIPSDTIPYFSSIFCNSTEYSVSDEEYSEGLGLFLSQFAAFNIIDASIKDIGETDLPKERRNCVHNCPLIRIIRNFILEEAA